MALPDDENASVLHRMAAKGIDLVSVRLVDFEHVFASASSAQEFITAVTYAFPEMIVSQPEKNDRHAWEVRCRKSMIPTHSGITEVEDLLGSFAQRVGGYSDGWGFLSNPDGSPAD